MRSSASPLVPIFRTDNQADLLAAIYLRPERNWTLALLAREFGLAASTLHGEVRRLENAELITATEIGRSRVLRPNLDHPLAEALVRILRYTHGPQAIIAEEFSAVPGADRVLIFGSWAARIEGQPGPLPDDIDVLVIGDAERGAVYAAADRAQERIGMPVNPVIASNRRWNGASDALIREIQANPVIDLTSDRTRGVAGDSMDTGARRHRANDQGS